MRVRLNGELKEQFFLKVQQTFGYRHGSIQRALIIAIQDWVNKP